MYSTSIAVLLLVTVSVVCADGDQYYIGVGRYDVTGPAVETEMVLHQFVYFVIKLGHH